MATLVQCDRCKKSAEKDNPLREVFTQIVVPANYGHDPNETLHRTDLCRSCFDALKCWLSERPVMPARFQE